MEDSAQRIVHLVDEENEQATNDLQSGASNELNKTGFPTQPHQLDPHHKSMLENIRHLGEHASRDALRVGKQTLDEMTVGSQHTNEIKGDEPLSIEAERQDKIAEQLKKAA